MDRFEAKYNEYYNVVRDIVIDRKAVYVGTSSFCDSKACEACAPKAKNVCEAQEVLKIVHSQELVKAELEEFFLQFDGNARSAIKDKCDILLYDNDRNRIAFCELTCSVSKYVEPYDNKRGHNIGKRAKAYKQLKSSIYKLAEVPEIASSMSQYNHRNGLLAVRYKNIPGLKESNELSNIKKFTSLTRAISKDAKSDIGKGFTFEVVQYPTLFRW